MATQTKIIKKEVKMKVSEYVEYYNSLHSDDKINRHHVYDMIKEGKLTAEKSPRNAWIIDVVIEETVKVEKPEKEYSVKKFVEMYNKKHPNYPVSAAEVRKLVVDGKLKGYKKGRTCVITASPRKRIK